MARQGGKMQTNQTRPLASLAIACLALATPMVARAGANTWTGSRPFGAQTETADIVAADPMDPYVVYAVFEPDLYRSGDGGRSWTRIASFTSIQSLLVHPAAPSTLYVGAGEGDTVRFGVFKSTDAGLTWTRSALGLGSFFDFVTTLAGSPTDPSTVFAGSASGRVYRTDDGGATWSSGSSSLDWAIASLVIDPRDESTLYSGYSTDTSYYYFPFGSFAKSSDGGSTWLDLTPGTVGAVSAIGIDPAVSSTLYIGVGESFVANSVRGVLRSEDAGVSFSKVSSGLPEDLNVTSLAMDPHNPGTLYAGTTPLRPGAVSASGVYRTRDSGATWTPFSQQLFGVPIPSLAFAGDGRVLRAGTYRGAFELEIAAGPIDVASGATGESRVLFWNADRLAVRTLDASGSWTSMVPDGPSLTWTATAIAGNQDGLARVLWQNGDGRSGLEIVGPTGRQSAFVFARLPGWMPTDVAAAADGSARLLWTSAAGGMFLSRVDSSGVSTAGPEYGPAGGWSAVAITDAPDGGTRVLWRCTDGRSGISVHDAAGVMGGSIQWSANAGSAAEDIAMGADGRLRLLGTSPDGKAQIWTVDVAGQLTAGQTHENPGFTPRRIATGADGLTRLLWNAADGSGSVWLLNPDNTLNSEHDTPVEP
jgi:hypothetical protein